MKYLVVVAKLMGISLLGYSWAQESPLDAQDDNAEEVYRQAVLKALDGLSSRLRRIERRLTNLEERAECAIPKPCIGRITGDAEMPAIRWHFQVPDGYERVGLVTYEAFIEYCHGKRHDRVIASPVISENDVERLTFDEAIQGGRLTLKASGKIRNVATGHTTTHETSAITSIRGVNPSIAAVKERLGNLDLQVMAFQESRFAQFKDSDGLPLFGAPNGYGIMQLDNPPATADQIWDWRANVDAGLALFAVKRQEAVTYPGRVRKKFPDATDFTPEQARLETIQRYNGGRYWNWNDERKEWEKAKNSGYADKINGYVQQIDRGDFPPGWFEAEGRW